MNAKPDWYEVLGVAPDCPQDLIRSRYLLLVQQLSSGTWKGGERPSLSTLHEAFRNLGDSVMRAGYDRSRARDQEQQAPVPEPAAAPAAAVRSCPFCESPLRADQAMGPEDTCSQCGAPLFPSQKHANMQDSRRLFDRLPFTMRVRFLRARVRNQEARGVSIDLSLGGLRLITPVQLELQERLMLDCEFCTAVAIVKRIQRATATQDDVWEAGLQFVTLSLKQKRGGLLSASA